MDDVFVEFMAAVGTLAVDPIEIQFRAESMEVNVHFSDFFSVSPDVLGEYGAFDVSLINDLPLFVDPFLLFNSPRAEYRKLHDDIITYLRFLRDKSVSGPIREGLLAAWFTFAEVRQNWLGYSFQGNSGRGLGMDFARALNENLNTIFSTFGTEEITKGSHLEKLCLIDSGVGRDNISDFTTNLIKEFLLQYTQEFARQHVPRQLRRTLTIDRVTFSYETETWQPVRFELPFHPEIGDFVILTPKEILTKDETWISRPDLLDSFEDIANAVPNSQLRHQINNYFLKVLPRDAKAREEKEAIAKVIRRFPVLIEHYIRRKEDTGDRAIRTSSERVMVTERQFVREVRRLIKLLAHTSQFYELRGDTRQEALERVKFLKDVIENKGGHRVFYDGETPISSEADLHILYRLTWFGTKSDVTREANDGRGPADFKISRGATDKTIVEFKLASNKKLRQNLENQTGIYKKASDAKSALSVIVYFSESERRRVNDILQDLSILNSPNVITIDASRDNKPSGSKA